MWNYEEETTKDAKDTKTVDTKQRFETFEMKSHGWLGNPTDN